MVLTVSKKDLLKKDARLKRASEKEAGLEKTILTGDAWPKSLSSG
jgi:hypothetical protein